MVKAFVQARRGTKMLKIYIVDLQKVAFLGKRSLPQIPPF